MSMDVSGVLIVGALVLYPLLELLTTGLLVWRAAHPENDLPRHERVLYALSLCVLPSLMLLAAGVPFNSDWKGMKGLGWFGVIDEDWAGAAVFPIWGVAAVGLLVGFIRTRWLHRSKAVLVMIATLAAVCLWYVSGVLARRMTQGGLPNIGPRDPMFAYLAGVPFMPAVNYVLLAVRIVRRGELAGRAWPFLTAWLGGLGATVWAKIALAMSHYATLADQAPDRCFIVSAAARGHRLLVGGQPDPATGEVRTAQLRRMRVFEARLAGRHPRLHRGLRRVYGVVGPVVAAGIRHPLLADAAYLALKPAEGLVCCLLGRQAHTSTKGDRP